MSHLDRLARRALCLHSEGAAAPLATHRPQAPAARKRGGGPAHFQPVSTMPLGRQPLPESGEIDSLCRAAAGIIPLITSLISAHNGAHAYPTEGVRRAQKMEPRSADHPSPAAQPVKGYTSPLIGENPQKFLKIFIQQLGPRQQLFTLPVFNSHSRQSRSSLQVEDHLHQRLDQISRGHVRDRNLTRSAPFRLQLIASHLNQVRAHRGVWLYEFSPQYLRIGLSPSRNFMQGSLNHQDTIPMRAICLPPLSLRGVQCCPGRHEDRPNAAKRLDPTRSLNGQPAVLRPISYRPNQKPNGSRPEHQPPQPKQGPLLPFARLHRSALPLTKLRLPAPDSPVHGGAA